MSRGKDLVEPNTNPQTKSLDSDVEYPKRLVSESGEAPDSLFEPFAAMWNLIRLDPSVVKGTVSAKTVLDRLREVVELSESAMYSKSPPGDSVNTGTKEPQIPVQEQAA